MTVDHILDMLDIIKDNLYDAINTPNEYDMIYTYIDELRYYIRDCGISEHVLEAPENPPFIRKKYEF